MHSNDEKQEKGKFVIMKAELDDAGNYSCFAGNDIATSTKNFIVKVSEPPTTTTVTTKIVTKSTSVKPDDKYLPAGTTEIPGETVTQGKATEKPDDNDSQGTINCFSFFTLGW
ncbi:hypothetical protein B566_EDAN010309 [Ephemera danica]|nr:hypothetical protein B566_EDAN010309 [Ephemera danica]